LVLIYLPCGNNVYGSKGGGLRGYGRCRGLKYVSHVPRAALPSHLFQQFSCLATVQTDGQTDSITPTTNKAV